MTVVRRWLPVVSVAFVLALVLISLTRNVAKPEGWGAFAWGWPVPWHTTGDLMVGGVSFLGFFLGTILWTRLSEDLLFWMAVTVPAVEAVSRFGAPLATRLLRARPWRRAVRMSRAELRA